VRARAENRRPRLTLKAKANTTPHASINTNVAPDAGLPPTQPLRGQCW
jgi:hypothetical protein